MSVVRERDAYDMRVFLLNLKAFSVDVGNVTPHTDIFMDFLNIVKSQVAALHA